MDVAGFRHSLECTRKFSSGARPEGLGKTAVACLRHGMALENGFSSSFWARGLAGARGERWLFDGIDINLGPGEVLVWDNLATMHRATAFDDQKYVRDMRRTTCRERAL